MQPLNLLLLVVGVGVMAYGITRVRGPLRRQSQLAATDANLRRYEDWRGGRRRIDSPGDTGADVMRQVLRDQIRRWMFVIGVGLALAFLAFFINT